MTRIYRYFPDELEYCGLAGDARLEITAQVIEYDHETMPSCVILLARLVFDDGQTREVTKQAQGNYEERVIEDFLRCKRKFYEGDEAS